MRRFTLVFCLPAVLLTTLADVSRGQPSDVITMNLYARRVPVIGDSPRLLPKDSELRPGNAAVVLLRMPWEETVFMTKVAPKVNEAFELSYDDPAIDEVVDKVGRFVQEMTRAAYIRSADWNYPIKEEPLAEILLPDAQGMRLFAGRIMYVWIGKQIAVGDLEKAREGILVQIACGRHVCRTPFDICNLVGQAIAVTGLKRLELLIQQPQAENFYYALANLPDLLGDIDAVFQMQGQMLEGTLLTLPPALPPIGGKTWHEIAAEFIRLVNMCYTEPMTPDESNELIVKLAGMAEESLPILKSYSAAQIEAMSDEEKSMRWILAYNEDIHSRGIFATSLSIPQAIVRLAEIEEETERLHKKLGRVVTPFTGMIGPGFYIALHEFDRRVKMLQTIEAIRDHASRNDNSLPGSLTEIDLPTPLDPLTNSPFLYVVDEGHASLSYPKIKGVDDKWQNLTRYEIHLEKLR